MSTKRRSFEKGHKRKFLVVIDDTDECERAVHWAASASAAPSRSSSCCA